MTACQIIPHPEVLHGDRVCSDSFYRHHVLQDIHKCLIATKDSNDQRRSVIWQNLRWPLGRFGKIVKISGLNLIFASLFSPGATDQNEGYETSRQRGSDDLRPTLPMTMLTLWFVLRLHRLASTIRS